MAYYKEKTHLKNTHQTVHMHPHSQNLKAMVVCFTCTLRQFCLYSAHLDHNTSSIQFVLCCANALQKVHSSWCGLHKLAVSKYRMVRSCASNQRTVIVRVCWGSAVVSDWGGTWCTPFQSVAKLSILEFSNNRLFIHVQCIHYLALS